MSALRVTAKGWAWSRAAVLALAIVVILVVGIVFAAVHDPSDSKPKAGSSPSANPPASTSPTPTASATPTPTAAPANPDLFDPPASFVWVPDDVAGTGAIDAAAAAALDGTGPLSQVGLQQLGFVRGVSRQWQDSPTVLIDLVYTFKQASQARTYVSTAVAARRADPEFAVVATPAGAPAGTTTFTNSANGSNSVAMIFASGTHVVVIGFVTAGSKPDPSRLVVLAAQQAALSATS